MIYILSADTLFRTMLRTELEARRFDCEVIDTIAKKQLGSNILLVDLDSCREVPGFCKYSVGWSRNIGLVSDANTEKCFCVLHRPFGIDEMCRQLILLSEKIADAKSRTAYKNDGNFPILMPDRTSCEYYGTQISLTPAEYTVLEILLSDIGTAVRSEEICRLINANADTLRVFICDIRKKLSAASDIPLIRTVKGIGYKINK